MGLWKGYVPSLHDSVFIAWVEPKSSTSDDVHAAVDDAYALVVPRLSSTPYNIFIVNVLVLGSKEGVLNETVTTGFIFVRGQEGQWAHNTDAAFVDKVLQAGLPQWSGGNSQPLAPIGTPAP